MTGNDSTRRVALHPPESPACTVVSDEDTIRRALLVLLTCGLAGCLIAFMGVSAGAVFFIGLLFGMMNHHFWPKRYS